MDCLILISSLSEIKSSFDLTILKIAIYLQLFIISWSFVFLILIEFKIFKVDGYLQCGPRV